MKRRDFSRILAASAAAPVLGFGTGVSAQDARWSMVADVAECCSCEIPCPCNFGRPTEKLCSGNRLIQIREGQFEGQSLVGIRFLVTFAMGRWTRIYIDESLSRTQRNTLDRLLPAAFTGFDELARSKTYVPMQVEDGGDTLKFTVPESAVEMRMMRGLDGDPIVINGLPSNVFHNYVQYESVVHRHSGPDTEWSHSGTNGFRSEMYAQG
ncbi:MAG: DUF1326 domain-containing protein [Pseudohongiellaceae bacterium]